MSELLKGATFAAHYEFEGNPKAFPFTTPNAPALREFNPPASGLETGIAAYFELGPDGSEETGAITDVFTEVGTPTYEAGVFPPSMGNTVVLTATDALTLTHAQTNGAFDFGTGDFAMHFKFLRSATTGTLQRICEKRDGVAVLGFNLRFTSGDVLQVVINDGVGAPAVTGVTVVTDTSWHSVSAFRVAGTVSIYLDGQLEASGSLATDVDNAGNFVIGHDGATQSFVGELDQALFHGPDAGFYGDIAAAAAAYHHDALGLASGITILRAPIVYGTGVRDLGAVLAEGYHTDEKPHFFIPAANAADFDSDAESVVIAAKVRLTLPRDPRSDSYHIFQKHDPTPGGAAGYELFATSSGVIFESSSGNSFILTAANLVVLGADMSIVFTLDAPTKVISLYVNGVLEDSETILSSLGILGRADQDVIVGGQASNSKSLGFVIDQLIYLRGRSWSAEEVLEYHAAVPRDLFLGATFSALYELESGGADEFGGPTLTPVNSPTYLPAVQGNGAQLTKVTNNSDSPHFTLVAGSAGDFDPGTESFVVAMKIRFDSIAATQVLFGKEKTFGAFEGWQLSRQGGASGIRFRVADTSASGTVDSTTQVSTGRDYSLVAVVDVAAGLVSLYVDAVLEDTADISALGSVAAATTRLTLGSGPTAAGFNLPTDGRIDQVVFLRGRAWDAADVLDYHGAAAGSPPGGWRRVGPAGPWPAPGPTFTPFVAEVIPPPEELLTRHFDAVPQIRDYSASR